MFSITCVKFLGQNYTLFTSSVDHSLPEAKQLTGRGVCVCVCVSVCGPICNCLLEKSYFPAVFPWRSEFSFIEQRSLDGTVQQRLTLNS